MPKYCKFTAYKQANNRQYRTAFVLDRCSCFAYPFEGLAQSPASLQKEMAFVPICIPNSYINPNVRTVGISKLRSLNASKLRGIDKTLVIQENDQPLAVLLKYEEFLTMQKQLMAVLETRAVLSDEDEIKNIVSGLGDAKSGKPKSIEEIRNSMTKTKEKA